MRFCLLFVTTIALAQPKPTPRQLAWQQLETTAFLHFTVNTFTDKEWGDGTESPAVFNPTRLDARQWVRALKDGGFKLVILTAKHHDGFCLWPSQQTEHSVKNSPYKGGKGDVVGEVANACREQGLKFGVYLSPWDRHEPRYGTAAYNDFYKAQLRELLTNYGPIAEVWFDGAKGENAKDMVYDFAGYWRMVRELQPNAVMFSDVGPDVRWVGNESGNAGETCWSTIDTTGMAPGKADAKYLNVGAKDGPVWLPAETDVSIRPGWFYHPAEDGKVRSPANLVDLYYQSVGRNSLLLLNVPPNRDGLLSNTDVANIREFRRILNETFRTNFVANVPGGVPSGGVPSGGVPSGGVPSGGVPSGGGPSKLTDKQLGTYLPVKTGKPLEIKLVREQLIDRIAIQENIANGQQIIDGRVEYWDGNAWQLLKTFTTVGHKRLLRFAPVRTSKVRLTITNAKGTIQLAEFGVYKAANGENE